MTIEPCFYATGAQTVRRWKWLGRLHQKNGLEHKTPKVRTLLVLRCDHRYGRANLRPAYYWSSTWPPLKTLACMWGAKEIATVLCAGLALRVAIVRAACFEGPPPSCFFCCPRLRSFVSLFLLFLQCFFFFSPLCSCVGQVMFGRNKIMSVTAFFLMKNVLRHGREKDQWLASEN